MVDHGRGNKTDPHVGGRDGCSGVAAGTPTPPAGIVVFVGRDRQRMQSRPWQDGIHGVYQSVGDLQHEIGHGPGRQSMTVPFSFPVRLTKGVGLGEGSARERNP